MAPNDDQGLVRPLVTQSGVIVWICDTGDEVWLDPRDVAARKPRIPGPPGWQVVEGVSVKPGSTQWAHREGLPDEWRGLELHE